MYRLYGMAFQLIHSKNRFPKMARDDCLVGNLLNVTDIRKCLFDRCERLEQFTVIFAGNNLRSCHWCDACNVELAAHQTEDVLNHEQVVVEELFFPNGAGNIKDNMFSGCGLSVGTNFCC